MTCKPSHMNKALIQDGVIHAISLQGIIFTISLVCFPLAPFLVLTKETVTASGEIGTEALRSDGRVWTLRAINLHRFLR